MNSLKNSYETIFIRLYSKQIVLNSSFEISIKKINLFIIKVVHQFEGIHNEDSISK